MKRLKGGSRGLDQPERDRNGEALGHGSQTVSQRVMRPAIAGARDTRMTAKGVGLPLLFAAIRVSAVAGLEIGEGQQARLDADAAEFYRLDRFRFRRRGRRGDRTDHPLWCIFLWSFRRRFAPAARTAPPWKNLAYPGGPESQPLGTADRRVSGEFGAESCIYGAGRLAIGHTPRQAVAQRVGVLRRPDERLHEIAFPGPGPAALPSPQPSDIRK